MNELKREFEQAAATLANLPEGEVLEVNVTDRTIAGLMMCKRLDRIADALESISSILSDTSLSLDSIDQTLTSCTASNGNNHFLRITGDVITN